MPSTPSPFRPQAFRRAFTLIELLVVISIIAILSGMVFAGVSVAKKYMLRARTVSLMSQLSAAITNYRTLSAGFPGDPPGNDWNSAFTGSNASMSSNVVAADWKVENSTKWAPLTAEALARSLAAGGDSDLVKPDATGRYLVDSFKQIIRYRPARLYPFDAAATILIDKDEPPNRDSYQLWSIGPDGKDQGGESISDDVVQWSR